jgi:AcrR family transcriptional regulator
VARKPSPISLDQTFVRYHGTPVARPEGAEPADLVHNGVVPPTDRDPVPRAEGSNQRQHILTVALSLMAQQGVDGTSMRNLATAAGLNVASLYHYFPSKRELLVAVLEEQGFVEDFIRLMMGEVMRGDDTAFAVGNDLFAATQASLEHWLSEHRPPLGPADEQAAMARMLRSLLVGIFFEHVAGVFDDGDAVDVFRQRADEVATLLRPRQPD